MSTDADTQQPVPTHSDRPASWQLVIENMQARDKFGREKYGTPLQPFNGRDSIVDAYQEALDLVVYLKNEIEEQKLRKPSEYLSKALWSDGLRGNKELQSKVLDLRDELRAVGL